MRFARCAGLAALILLAAFTAPRLGAGALTGGEVIVDNRDPGFAGVGSWFIGDGGHSYNGDCAWAPRGTQNVAAFRPALPAAGSYEVFGWWCGDPNHDQSRRQLVRIRPSQVEGTGHVVYVVQEEEAGRWVSLGTYYLEADAFVTVEGDLNGNTVADAFRFVYRAPERIEVAPTPLPTPQGWTNHPPSPLEQVTSVNLAARLGVVSQMYEHTPIRPPVETVFDDCQAFPRDGCGGQTPGWQVEVTYNEHVVPYRVSKDYHLVSLELPQALRDRQLLYLFGQWSGGFLRVDRYFPDDSWHLSRARPDGSGAVHRVLDRARVDRLLALAGAYGKVVVRPAAGSAGLSLWLYGQGPRVALSPVDEAACAALGQELMDEIGRY